MEAYPKDNAPGILVTFEGGDGSGKSTHVEFLARTLKGLGLDVVCVREPGGTKIGEQLRDMVLDPDNSAMSDRTELLIYEAARAQLMEEVIKPALSRGAVVICDRFTDSSLVYQGFGRGIGLDLIDGMNDFATGGIFPDATIVFKSPGKEGRADRLKSREALDRLETEGDEFNSRIAQGFAALVEKTDPRYRVIDSKGPHSKTALSIFKALGDVFPALADGSINFTGHLAAFDAEHDHGDAGN